MKEKRTVRMGFVATKLEHEKIKKKAKKMGITIASYIRYKCLKEDK